MGWVFHSEKSEVWSLVHALVDAGIIHPHKPKNHLDYLASIGRLLQSNIGIEPDQDEVAVRWFMKTIGNARRRASQPYDNNGVRHMLNWNLSIENPSQWQRDLTELFNHLNNPALWSSFDGTLSTLLANQSHYQDNSHTEGRRRVVLFKLLENGSYDVRLREGVDIPLAQRQSALLNCLREREDRSGDVLDTTTRRHMENAVAELREGNAMVIRLE